MFNHIKTIGLTTLGCCAFIFTASAQAGADLTIMNNTNHSSTALVNNGPCSSTLGKIGITKAHSPNVVPWKILDFICSANKQECKASVYVSENCSGPAIATATLNIATGIVDKDKDGNPGIVNNGVDGYMIVGSGFHIDIYGGPAVMRD